MVLDNKRASAQDVIFIVVAMFALGVGFLSMYLMANNSYDKMINNSVINSSAKTIEVLQAGKAVSSKLDYILFGFFIGSVLAIMISSYFIGGQPVFMFIYFLIVVVGVVVSIVLSYIWGLVSTASVFGASVSAFPLTNNILSYLSYYTAIIGVLGFLVMFAKLYFDSSQVGGY